MSRVTKTIRAFAAASIAASALALPASASAEGNLPTGPDVRPTVPKGDIHYDRGVEPNAKLANASDVTGLRLAWPSDGLKIEVTLAGDPRVSERNTSYSNHIELMDRSDRLAGSWTLEWDGEEFDLWKPTGRFVDMEACGATGTLSGTTLTYWLPADCLGESTTLWATGSSGWATYTVDGDVLISGDERFHKSTGTYYDGEPFAIVHRNGTSPEQADPDATDHGVATTADRAPEAGRIDLADPTGDSGADSETDITRFIVDSQSDGSVKATVTASKGLAGEDLAVAVFNRNAELVYGEAQEIAGEYRTQAYYREAQDWGLRACTSDVSGSGSTITFTFGSDCGAYSSFKAAAVDLGQQGFLGFRGDSVLTESASFSRSAPPKPATNGRDVGATCDGRDAQTEFSDTSGNVHAAMIDCLSAYGITQGKGNGVYGTKDPLSRGQVATFLKKTLEAAGETLSTGNGACAGRVHGDSLDALVAAGIMEANGCDLTSKMSRTDMAQATANAMTYAGVSSTDAPDYFHDDEWMSAEVQVAHDAIAHRGIVTGKKNGVFAPAEQLRRDQMATFLARLLDTLKA